MSIFISHSDHSNVDRRFVDTIRNAVNALLNKTNDADKGVFVDHEDIPGSSPWLNEINKRLKCCDHALFLITPSFLKSKWLIYEFGAFCGKHNTQTDSADDKILLATVGSTDANQLIAPIISKQHTCLDGTPKVFEDLVRFISKGIGHKGKENLEFVAKFIYNGYLEFVSAYPTSNSKFEFNSSSDNLQTAFENLFNLKDLEIIGHLESIFKKNRAVDFTNFLLKNRPEKVALFADFISFLGERPYEEIKSFSSDFLSIIRDNNHVQKRETQLKLTAEEFIKGLFD